MIIDQVETEFTSSKRTKSFSYGIKEEDSGHIFDILRNKLYSNKPLALLREYATNSFDAHVECGIPNRPFEVTLPSSYDPMLRIRDFGKGLDEEEIEEVYSQYGCSTRRVSNQFVGAMGLGCKSFGCYSNTMTITSIKNGVKTFYNAIIDETKRGKIVKLQSQKTIEETGIEIAIPVNNHDFGVFKQTAFELYKYFKVRPLIKGVTPPPEYINPPKPILEGNNWKIDPMIAYTNPKAVVVMGNVPYPLDCGLLKLSSFLSSIVSNNNLSFDIDIGSADVSASRESLEYTPKTVDSIVKKLTIIGEEIKNNVVKEFDSCTSYFGFCQKYFKSLETHIFKYIIGNITLNYKGLPPKKYVEVKNPNIEVWMFSGSYRKKTITEEELKNPAFEVITNRRIFWNDVTDAVSYKRRLKSDKILDHCSILKFKNGYTVQDFIKEYDLTGINIEAFSTVPEIKVVRGSYTVDVKHRKKVFTFDITSGLSYDNKSYWKIDDIDLDEGWIYVKLDRFKFYSGMNNKYEDCSGLSGLLVDLKNIGLEIKNLYGFKEKWLSNQNLGPIWKDLFTYLNENIKKLPLTGFLKDIVNESNRQTYEEKRKSLFRLKNFKQNVTSDTIKKYISLTTKPQNVHINSKLFETYITPNFKSDSDLEKLDVEIDKRYPLLNLINTIPSYTLESENNMGNILDYINNIDSSLEISEKVVKYLEEK